MTSKAKIYRDPLGLDDVFDPMAAGGQLVIAPLVVTGLSDEEDAARHLTLRFDRTIGFCRNCEGYYPCEMHGEIAMTTWCPACKEYFLTEPGTKPLKRKT